MDHVILNVVIIGFLVGVSSGHCLLTFKIQLRDNFDKDHNYFSLKSTRALRYMAAVAAAGAVLACHTSPIDMKPINV